MRAASVKNGSSDDEKAQPTYGRGVVEPYYGDVEDPLEENEVFKKTHDSRGCGLSNCRMASSFRHLLEEYLSSQKFAKYQLMSSQLSLQLEFSVSQHQCTVWVLSEVLFQSLAGELSTPTLPLFKGTSAIPTLVVIPSPTCLKF